MEPLSIVSLTLGLLGGGAAVTKIGQAIAAVAPTDRQCSIKITNTTANHVLDNPSMYIQSGNCASSLPHEIHPDRETTVEFTKTPGLPKGAAGVFTYDLYDPSRRSSPKKLAVMFSVPFNFRLYSNWYAAGLIEHSKRCDQDLYKEMYYNEESRFVRRMACSNITYVDVDFKVMATMANTYTPVISVIILDKRGKQK